MRLVIGEKPSVSQSLAAVLGAKNRKNGYIEGNDYLISWCYGHLAELTSAGEYNSDYAKWSMKDLPILPESFKFVVKEDKKEQFECLKTLLNREDVSEVINACDAGREGELIFRTVYNLSGCKKPVKRLWISSMEDDAIREGFGSLKDGNDYEGLYQAALCRAKADWLVGINATRFFSLLYGQTLNVGRVVSPTLSLLVQRESEINTFKSVPFYTVELDCGFSAVSKRIDDKVKANDIASSCEEKEVTVTAIESKEVQEKAPALYDLTTLQRDANRILGYTAKQTLDYLQSLYEQKLCTYPRTDSRYLTDGMEKHISDIVIICTDFCGLQPPDEICASQVCSSKKVSDHHAIIPTAQIVNADISELSDGEYQILKLLAKSAVMAVCPPYRCLRKAVTLNCSGYDFTARGNTVISRGWKNYQHEKSENQEEKTSELPELAEGETLTIKAAKVKEGKTTSPKQYTEDTLLSAMENAGKADMPEDVERKGIGTPATRAGILEKLVSGGFAQRNKSGKHTNLVPGALGIALISVLPDKLSSPQLTAQWEQKLKQVEHGQLDSEIFISGISEMIKDLVDGYEPAPGSEALFPSNREIVGKCPRCGENVSENSKGFFCENHSCSFALWKNSRFFSAKKKELTTFVAQELLNEGKVNLIGCYSEKTGKTYDATIILKDDGKETSFVTVFGNKNKNRREKK